MDRLRIGIDGYNLAMPAGTGIATYGYMLAHALRGMGHGVEGVFGIDAGADARLRETHFFDALAGGPMPASRIPRWRRRLEWLRAMGQATAGEVPLTDKVAKQVFADRLPRFDRLVSSPHLFDRAYKHFRSRGRFVTLTMDNPPEVMHWTYPVPITLAGARNIYTLHDLVPLKLPYATLDQKAAYRAIAAQCLEAAHVCTVSEASKADIEAEFPEAAGRVVNTYQVAPAVLGSDETAEESARMVEGVFGLSPKGYFLYYGALEPKKNVGRIIEAYLALQTQTPLVIVGARAWQSEAELMLIPGGGADGSLGTFAGSRGQSIVRLAYLPRETLARLVRGAKALVFPSLYEGFGLPVLEAMQMGTPVITSSASALPEIAGDAALLVDPFDVRQLMAAMARIDGDPALAADLAERGSRQATNFSEARYQTRLATLYDRAMAAPAAAR